MRKKDLDWWIPRLMVATVLAVAAFAFVQSYTHGFYWGQTHHQTGTSLRMFPLIADWIMFAAGLTMLHLGRKGIEHPLPRLALILGATVTLVINIAAGIIWGWQTALTNSWAPVALFVVVELGMLLVRTAKAKPEAKHGTGQLGTSVLVPDMDHADNATDTASTYPAGQQAVPVTQLTQLSQPQGTHDPSPETATFPRQVDSPEPALQGWGQLAGQEERPPGLNGIGLRNNRGV